MQSKILDSHKGAANNAKTAICHCHKLLGETLVLCQFLRSTEVQQDKTKRGVQMVPLASPTEKKAGDSYLVNKTELLSPSTKEDMISTLNRIHTFNMRETAAGNESSGNVNEEMSSVCPSKTFYFEENMMVLEKLVASYEPVLVELTKKISTHDDRLEKIKDIRIASLQGCSALSGVTGGLMGGAAFTRGKIDEMKRAKQFKIKPRSILGLKSKEDWIFNINIGNVMHLSPLSLEDLAMSPQVAHEICRDALYEKIIMLAIGYFSLATECRFIFAEDSSEFCQAESRYWHKAAVELVCTFLPVDCPLVGHIVNSYEKHNSLAQEVIVKSLSP